MTSLSTSNRRFLGPEEMEEAVEALTDKAKRQGVEAAVIGGYAMQYYGSTRMTTDVDFMADRRLRGFSPQGKLSFGGVQIIAPNQVPVDWVVRDDGYARLYEQALQRAGSVGRRFRIVGPEYLAAMKLAAARPKDEEDLRTLLELGILDMDKVRKIIERTLGQFAREEFDRLVEEAEWRRERKK